MTEEAFRAPVRLTGRLVELVPPTPAHAPDLMWALRDPEVTRLWRGQAPRTVEDAEEFIRYLLDHQAAGTDLPFITTLRATGRPIGATRFLRIRPGEPRGRGRRDVSRLDLLADPR